MDQKLKSKWVRALRSGRYEQADGTLLDNDGAMCCLGVLATLQGCNLSALSEDERTTTDLPRGFNAGIPRSTRTLLGRMNDGDEGGARSFKQIAEYIAKRL